MVGEKRGGWGSKLAFAAEFCNWRYLWRKIFNLRLAGTDFLRGFFKPLFFILFHPRNIPPKDLPDLVSLAWDYVS
jgi:hypothetical protein